MVTDTIAKPKDLILTTVFNQLTDAWLKGKRRAFIEGGTWSSKTYSVMQLLKLILDNYKEPILGTVMSESMPHLKGGAMLDFLTIMGDELIDSYWNRTDFIYTFPKSGCRLEFISADRPGRVTGPRREILFCNEINNLLYESYWQADMRTRFFTICDWNPTSEFWFHDKKLKEEEENTYIHVTYLDALEVLSESKRREIEDWKDKDPRRWRVYGLGLPGDIEGLVYPEFEQVDKLPDGHYFYGLDYGFASDPTTLVKNIIIEDNLYSQEMFYNYNSLTNEDIAREMRLCSVGHNEPIWADRNELKSAEELRRLGYNVRPVDKAFYGREYRIKQVNTYRQHWTSGSLNCIKEQRNYSFLEDRDHAGRFTDKTTHQWSHGLTAREFGVVMHIPGYTGREPVAVSNH